VLLDLSLPDGNGLDVVAELRAIETKTAKHALVMAVTGNKGSRQVCMAGGIDGYLEKPYDRVKLLSVLNKLLGKTQPKKAAD
jgi:CheY-like chemotaxis protein